MSVELEPGKKLTSAERAALVKENEKETEEAHRLAREHQDRDIAEGRKPAVIEVAESIQEQMKDKFGEQGEK